MGVICKLSIELSLSLRFISLLGFCSLDNSKVLQYYCGYKRWSCRVHTILNSFYIGHNIIIASFTELKSIIIFFITFELIKYLLKDKSSELEIVFSSLDKSVNKGNWR